MLVQTEVDALTSQTSFSVSIRLKDRCVHLFVLNASWAIDNDLSKILEQPCKYN